MLLFRSKLLREEIKHWAALAALFAWALTASLWGWSKEEKIILIAIENGGTRLVSDEKDKILEMEVAGFIKNFLETFYQYNSDSYSRQMGKATDLMSEELWQEKQSELARIGENLKSQAISQSIEIQSIDKVGENQFEAVILIAVKSRMSTQSVRLKIQLKVEKSKRSGQNPYPLQIDEIHETNI